MSSCYCRGGPYCCVVVSQDFVDRLIGIGADKDAIDFAKRLVKEGKKKKKNLKTIAG